MALFRQLASQNAAQLSNQSPNFTSCLVQMLNDALFLISALFIPLLVPHSRRDLA